MKRCPHCDTENVDVSTYCERCGTLLSNPTQYASSGLEHTTPSPREYEQLIASTVEYNVSSQSGYALPTDNYTAPPSPPPDYSNFSTYTFPPQEVIGERISPRSKTGAFIGTSIRTILYLVGAFIAAFGLFGTLLTLGSSDLAAGLALVSGFALLIVSIIILVVVLVWHKPPRLRWPTRILWLFGVTGGACIAAILENAAIGISSHDPLSNFIFFSITLLYGAAFAVIAVW
jgi:hypothetical protein